MIEVRRQFRRWGLPSVTVPSPFRRAQEARRRRNGTDTVVASLGARLPGGRFAVWTTAWLNGRTSYDEALEAVAGDRVHSVSGLPYPRAGSAGVGADRAAGLGERRPAGAARARRRPWAAAGARPRAAGAGGRQAAVGDRLALPEAGTGGRRLDGVRSGRRRCRSPPVEGTLRAVSGALDLAVGDAARTLARLDVARWNPEVPSLLAGLATPAAAPELPGDHDPLAVSVLGRAAAGAGARPRDGRRARRRGQPRPGGRPRLRPAAVGRRRPRGRDRRLQHRPR